MGRMLRITDVEPLDGYRVRLRLANGEVVERGLGTLLRAPVFAPLRDPRLFERVSVEDGTLVWPGELDIAPETLIWDGPDPADPGARPPAFLEPRNPHAALSDR